jgi:hypothetical protein
MRRHLQPISWWLNGCSNWACCYLVNYYGFTIDNLCQHIAWHPSSEVPHQGQICLSQHKEGRVWDICANLVHTMELVLMALRAFDGKQPIMGRAWLVMKTLEWHDLSLWNQPLSLPSMEDVENQLTLCMDLSQSILIGWNLPSWWCKCEKNVKSHVTEKH